MICGLIVGGRYTRLVMDTRILVVAAVGPKSNLNLMIEYLKKDQLLYAKALHIMKNSWHTSFPSALSMAREDSLKSGTKYRRLAFL